MRCQSQHLLKLEQDLDLLQLQRSNPERYPYFLESVLHGTPQSRFDILFACPAETMSSDSEDFLTRLDDLWRQQRIQVTSMDVPFCGGWFVYLGYELANEIEPTLKLKIDNTDLPTAFATRIPAALIHDHKLDCHYLVCEPGAEEYLSQITDDINRLEDVDEPVPSARILELVEEPAHTFLNGVEKIRDYIREGDVFQVNLSRAWEISLMPISAMDLYRSLRNNNPAPFAALINYQGKAIISSSPERLVNLVSDRISTRPIAGTHPRGGDEAADLASSSALLQHPKERAEHVMLIDLERNDLGRVCEPGTVEVDEFMVLESYSHVHHIVSNVCGKRRTDITPVDVIRAVFPGGTITGCPKVRCMEIIQELEQTQRGPYTGAVGYISHCGRMDLNILIRTMLLNGDQLSFRTGAGIVADSIADTELQETRAKAKGLLRALGINGDVHA